jgi:Tol biopolymer transport system component
MKFSIFIVVMLVMVSFAQTVKVLGVDDLTSMQDGAFYHPRFSPDGSKILFCGAGYTGLLYYDLSNKQIIRINAHRGAGYEPVFSAEGDKVFFRIDSYERGRKFTSIGEYDFNTNSQQIIRENSRNVSLLGVNQDSGLLLRQVDNIEIIKAIDRSKKNSARMNEPIIYARGEVLFVEKGGIKKELVPFGKGNYIWPSLSPDQERIVFTFAGKGTYICDLDGNIETDIGYANAPQWSSDGNWIAYMLDTDDGHQYLSSDIYVTAADGSQRFNLTDAQQIYMYPQWSPDMRQIVVHSEDGIIYLLKLQIN